MEDADVEARGGGVVAEVGDRVELVSRQVISDGARAVGMAFWRHEQDMGRSGQLYGVAGRRGARGEHAHEVANGEQLRGGGQGAAAGVEPVVMVCGGGERGRKWGRGGGAGGRGEPGSWPRAAPMRRA
ncbi:hypothetical protein A6V37_37785 [Paraburkholderia ginsengiterrae]|uniref:Uncharacterized protein n=1 Tax=Paraburkholderia ginsengiterrae TaxID=1462993 RepID=A0A1A9NFK8_9BURK|nr:hypothetical protein A6V37_37785 [Paraburkholderia ginsengiterrae]